MAENSEERKVRILLDAQQANASIKEMGAAAAIMNSQLAKMSQDDPRRAQLINDHALLRDRIRETTLAQRTYVQSAEELAREQAHLIRQNREVILNGQHVTASFKDMKSAAALLERQLHELSSDDPGRAKMLRDYQALQQRLSGVQKEMGETAKQGLSMKDALSFAGVTLGAEAIVGSVISLGKEVLETTAKYEKYEAVLKNALGSQEKATKAMSDIEQMAAKTPFSVDELTDSYIKFVNRGLNPSMNEMGKLADIAASQGKSFDQLTEAVLDAGSGEFERLKEFGIKASKSGDDVSLSFKGVNQTVANTPAAINGAIMAFGAMQGVAGSTAAISATLEGQMSNLGDQSDQLEKKVGNGLKPVFTAIISVFGTLMGWFTRLLDNLGPVGDLFNAISKEVSGLYVEIRDIIVGLGLFDSKTDSVKLVVQALTTVLTLLTFGIRTVLGVVRGLADGFIYLYNKSELVRGVLGGLAAVVTTTFKTIKDDALKYLGGVGDIIVGIFSLDTEKIKAGFRATMAATADVAFKSGMRNAKAFVDGYNANKGNKITRSVSVSTRTVDASAATDSAAAPAAGAGGTTAAEREKARKEAEKHRKQELAEQKQHDQQRLKATQEWVKQEGQLLEYRDLFMAELGQRVLTDEEQRRRQERTKLFDEATKKVAQLTGLELDYTEQVKAIVEERDLSLRELAGKFAEQDLKEKQQALDQKLADEEATTAERLAQLELDLANGVLDEQAFQDAVFLVQQSAAGRELELLRQRYGAESAEVKKKNAEILRAQAEHIDKTKGLDLGMRQFQQGLAAARKVLGSEEVAALGDLFGKKSGLYKAFVVAQKALALTEIGLNLATEIQQHSKNAAQNPLNGVTAGAAGTAQFIVQSGLSIVRAGAASAKVLGFREGGRTEATVGKSMLDLNRLTVSSSGKLLDQDGFPVAGVVHENEYVIPEWMRADPKVIQVEQWLEQKRQRGYLEGGATSDDVVPAGVTAGTGAGNDQLLVQVLGRLDSRLQGVEQWQRELAVYLEVQPLEQTLEERDATRKAAEIR